MTDITNRLLELDPTLARHNEGHWNEPYSPEIGGFSSFNDAGIEVETGEFLYALVRLLKPLRVLETGTHVGVGASYMGMALKDNMQGQLVTVEFIPENFYRARERLQLLGLNKHGETNETVVSLLEDVKDITPTENYQLILLDTEPQTRFAELIKFFQYLDEGGFIFIHDLHRHMGQTGQNPDHPNEKYWPWGEMPQEIIDLVKNKQLLPFHFDTPRGLTGFYKPKQEDFFVKNGFL